MGIRALVIVVLGLIGLASLTSAQTRETVIATPFTNATTLTSSLPLQNIGQATHTIQVLVASRPSLTCTANNAKNTLVTIDGSSDNSSWLALAPIVDWRASQNPFSFTGVAVGIYPFIRVTIRSLNANCQATVGYTGSRYIQSQQNAPYYNYGNNITNPAVNDDWTGGVIGSVNRRIFKIFFENLGSVTTSVTVRTISSNCAGTVNELLVFINKLAPGEKYFLEAPDSLRPLLTVGASDTVCTTIDNTAGNSIRVNAVYDHVY